MNRVSEKDCKTTREKKSSLLGRKATPSQFQNKIFQKQPGLLLHYTKSEGGDVSLNSKSLPRRYARIRPDQKARPGDLQPAYICQASPFRGE